MPMNESWMALKNICFAGRIRLTGNDNLTRRPYCVSLSLIFFNMRPAEHLILIMRSFETSNVDNEKQKKKTKDDFGST